MQKADPQTTPGWHEGNNPDAHFTEPGFAGWLMVYTPSMFKTHHIAWWNCDLPFNGHPTGWERFPSWQVITHWRELDKPS